MLIIKLYQPNAWQNDILSQSAFLLIIFIDLGNWSWDLAYTRKVILTLLFSTHFLEFLPQCHYVTICVNQTLIRRLVPSAPAMFMFCHQGQYAAVRLGMAFGWKPSLSEQALCPHLRCHFANKSPHFTCLSSSFCWHHVGLVRGQSILSCVSGTLNSL